MANNRPFYKFLHEYDVPPIAMGSYPKCKSCGYRVWSGNLIFGLCPICIFNLPQFELELSFTKSSSANYKKAVGLAKKISGYAEEKTTERLLHIVRFRNLDEYNLEYIEQRYIARLIMLISKWKYFQISLNNNRITIKELSAINNTLIQLFRKYK